MQKNISISQQVVSAIVKDENRFLLVKRKNPPSKGMYAFPGGRVETQETLENAVLRELKEETGLIGQMPKLYTRYDLTREGGNVDLSVFKISVQDTQYACAQDDAEELGWFTINDVKSLEMPPNMHDCFKKLATE